MGINPSALPPHVQRMIAEQAGAAKPKPRQLARVRNHVPGTMNKLEADYAAYLAFGKVSGEIRSYAFEAVKLRLAKLTFYTPDFLVITANGEVEFHEAKGFWEDDARVKIKVAAEMYPFFRFIAVTKRAQKHGGGWEIEEFKP